MPFRSQTKKLAGEWLCPQSAPHPSFFLPPTSLALFSVLYQPCAMNFYPRTFAQPGPSALTSVYLFPPLTSCFSGPGLCFELPRETSVHTYPFHSSIDQVLCVCFQPTATVLVCLGSYYPYPQAESCIGGHAFAGTGSCRHLHLQFSPHQFLLRQHRAQYACHHPSPAGSFSEVACDAALIHS